MVEKEEFSKRLNEICDDRGVPPKGKNRQSILGKKFGVTQQGARKWLEAENIPEMDKCIAIARWGKVSVDWLLTGRGRKALAVDADPYIGEVNKLMEPMTEARKYDVVRIVKAITQEDAPEPEPSSKKPGDGDENRDHHN